jgi:hypothetical protein
MTEDLEPTAALLAGRRAVEGVHGVALLDDLCWRDRCQMWTLHYRLTVTVPPNSPIPASTEWYVLVDPAYPWGKIEFHPAQRGGLHKTFPHQQYNGRGREDEPWRRGNICVSTSLHIFGRRSFDVEPYGADERLRWNVERACEWLTAAAHGRLRQNGDPFELPEFPNCCDTIVAFCEDPGSYEVWKSITDRCGTVDLVRLREDRSLLLAKTFRSVSGDVIRTIEWGPSIPSGNLDTGIWTRWDSTPILDLWQAPATWHELWDAARPQRVDFGTLLRAAAERIRDGQQHLALLGWPIPVKLGDECSHMHWQAIRLPRLSWKNETVDGFRSNAVGHWQRDRTVVLKGEISWCQSENWDRMQIATRGRYDEAVCSRHALLIGAGALGARIGELLVRGGVHRMTIMDGETVSAGNLVRHTLTLDDIGQGKADAVAKRLAQSSPHARISALGKRFPPDPETTDQVRAASLILDCTGKDDVLHHLSMFPWNGERLFASISLGLRARRLFCFAAYGPSFPHEEYVRLIQPWMRQELDECDGYLPREAVGCWHPVFPARCDDVQMMAAAATKYIERIAISPPSTPQLVVYEQRYDGAVFTGIAVAALGTGNGAK